MQTSTKPLAHLSTLLALSLVFASPAAAEPAATGRFDVETRHTLPTGLAARAAHLRPLAVTQRYVGLDGGAATPKAIVGSEGFEGAFPGTAWTLINEGVDAGWGRSTRRRSAGNASGWCAQSGSAAPAPGQNVRNNMRSWMITGPIDLGAATAGSLAFDLFLRTEAGFDTLFVGASLNGTSFVGFGSSQDTSGFERFAIDLTSWGSLGDLTGESQVWFAFLYTTDGSATFEGAYLDQIVLDVTTAPDLNLVINQIDASACPTMQAFVSVTDGQGDPVIGLRRRDFTLMEDGAARTVTSQPVATSDEALATALVLDGSGSLSNADVANIKVASNGFIDLLAARDSVAVYHFGSDVTRVQDYTTNHAAARAAVDTLTDNLGNTSLYDAIVEAAQHSSTVGGRRALLVMTDGMNNDSAASEQDAIDAAIAAGVPVFTIGFGNVDVPVLQRIADQTGGRFFQGADSADLVEIFDRIGQTLGQQYVLSWTADAVDGATHTVKVDVNHQGESTSRTATYSQADTPCANAGVCVGDDTTLCLNGGRFRVRVQWTDFAGVQGPARVAPCGSDDSGILYFFSENNWEMLVKVLDGCRDTDRYWVFFSATTNVGYRMTVTDTLTGAVKRYTNPVGNAPPAVTDTSAFATCP